MTASVTRIIRPRVAGLARRTTGWNSVTSPTVTPRYSTFAPGARPLTDESKKAFSVRRAPGRSSITFWRATASDA